MFKYVILFIAFLLAACAAWFSVSGIAQLFVGATIAVGTMAVALEAAKIVSASFLYRYWNDIPKSLRLYMWSGTIILMVITSIGIYGYLTTAYAYAATDIRDKESKITLYENQTSTIDKNIERLTMRSNQLIQLRNQQENRLDELIRLGRGTSTQQRIIREQDVEIASMQKQINELSTRRDSLQTLVTNAKGKIDSSGKLGTFYYIANTIGVPLDTIVKWFTLIIVLVFDPMSISLFLAYNLIVKKNSSKNQNEGFVVNTDDLSENVQSISSRSSDTSSNTPIPDVDPIADNSNMPYYRRSDFEWIPGGSWESDPEAIAWRREVG